MKNVPKKVAEAFERIGAEATIERIGAVPTILSDAITLMEFIKGLPEDTVCRKFVADEKSAKHCRRCGYQRHAGDHMEGDY